MSKKEDYRRIFKSTFLFGFVQVFNISVKIVLNKIIAIYLGTSGIGMIGLYQSAISILRTFSSLGIHQSAVKDVSEIYVKNGKGNNTSRIINIVKKVVIGTALIGALITIVMSPWLSRWSFKSNDFTIPYIWLSLVVVFNILTEGYLSILKGLRRLRSLAKASMMGAAGGVLAGIPLYIYFGEKGIVPALIATSFFTFLFAFYYVSKIQIDKIKVSIREILFEGSNMIRMGFALMITSFAALLSGFIVRSYISGVSGLEQVGLFQVGSTILSAYFGIVITALVTDYYPRIAAVNWDNKLVAKELNRQIKVGFLIVGPLIVMFMVFLKPSLVLLYSNDFLASSEYIVFAVFGTLIIIASNPMDLVLVAKAEAKLFLLISLFYRSIEIGLFILGYELGGLSGLGIAVTVLAAFHFIIMFSVNRWKYKIYIERKTWQIIVFVFLLTFFSVLTNEFQIVHFRLVIEIILILTSFTYSFLIMKNNMKINLVGWCMEKIKLRFKK